MKAPPIRLPRPSLLLIAGLYLLAGISAVKLLPWFDSMATRSIPGKQVSHSAQASASQGDFKLPLQSDFALIDFKDRETPITVEIYPPHKRTPVKITFFTGSSCSYDNHRACVHTYHSEGGQPILFLTIHSGMEGEAEHFRHYLEGTGINRAGYSLKQAQAVLHDLRGAQVILRQEDRVVNDLEIGAVGRVPPASLKEYFAAPISRSLNVAAAADPALEDYVYPDQPLLVIETCGWRMPGEKNSPAASDTTGSIYLAVIHERN